jgi:hypothetical protein
LKQIVRLICTIVIEVIVILHLHIIHIIDEVIQIIRLIPIIIVEVIFPNLFIVQRKRHIKLENNNFNLENKLKVFKKEII